MNEIYYLFKGTTSSRNKGSQGTNYFSVKSGEQDRTLHFNGKDTLEELARTLPKLDVIKISYSIPYDVEICGPSVIQLSPLSEHEREQVTSLIRDKN